MKAQLGKKADEGSAPLAQVEDHMAAINAAIAQVRNSSEEDHGDIVMGRAPGA